MQYGQQLPSFPRSSDVVDNGQTTHARHVRRPNNLKNIHQINVLLHSNLAVVTNKQQLKPLVCGKAKNSLRAQSKDVTPYTSQATSFD
eukprot:jgi/Botrbrau1/1533/Bobra.0107s0021.1